MQAFNGSCFSFRRVLYFLKESLALLSLTVVVTWSKHGCGFSPCVGHSLKSWTDPCSSLPNRNILRCCVTAFTGNFLVLVHVFSPFDFFNKTEQNTGNSDLSNTTEKEGGLSLGIMYTKFI